MSRTIPTLKTWPLGTPLPSNGLFVFYDPAQDDEFRVLPEQLLVVAPDTGEGETVEELLEKLQEGTGIKLQLLPSGRILITCTLEAATAPIRPAAPTDAQFDDDGDRFSGIAVPGYGSFAEYEASGLPGTTGIVPLTTANSSQSGNRIYLKGLTGPIPVRTVGFRVAASGNRPAGAFLMNLEAFTGPVVLPKGYGLTYTDQYPPAG